MLSKLTAQDVAATGVSVDEAQWIVEQLRDVVDPVAPPEKAWRCVSKHLLRPDHPFPLHKLLLEETYKGRWDSGMYGAPPVWSPSAGGAAQTNLARFMRDFKGCPDWDANRSGDPCLDLPLLHRVSCLHPEHYWPPVLRALGVTFHHPSTRVLQLGATADECRWLPGARLNIAECCLLSGADPDAPAVLYATEAAPDAVHCVTYGDLARQAYRFASALRTLGLQPGDGVGLVMPMTVQAVIAYLGTVLAGCVVVGIADSFSAEEIGARLRIGRASLVVTQDVIVRGDKALPLYQRLVETNAPRALVLPAAATQAPPGTAQAAALASRCAVQLRPGDLPWAEFVALARPGFTAHVADAYDTTNVLFSSGTTGEPKAIPWTHITPIKAGADAWAHQDVRRGDVVAWPTSMGWMMGPWLMYACLLNKAAVALFYGSPLGRPFGRFVSAARVSMLGLVPSIAKAWRASNCMQGLDWCGHLRCFSSSGEASAPEDCHWLMARGGYAPVIEYCGGTEIGGAFLTGAMLQPQVPSTFSMPAMGSRLFLAAHVNGDSATGSSGSGGGGGGGGGYGDLSPHGSLDCVSGELVLGAPSLGLSQTLLNKDHSVVYYQGMPPAPCRGLWLRRHGDEVARLPGGRYAAQGRSDDTMNLGGIKVSSIELERCITRHVPRVREAAAVGLPTLGGGPEGLVLFLVMEGGGAGTVGNGGGTCGGGTSSSSSSSGGGVGGGIGSVPKQGQLLVDCQGAVRKHLNPLFKVEKVVAVQALPRNASNKVMRRVLRDQLMAQQHVQQQGQGRGRAKL